MMMKKLAGHVCFEANLRMFEAKVNNNKEN